MSATDLVIADGSVLMVRGCLDITTVTDYRHAGAALIRDRDPAVFDLSECEAQGSAVLALLIAWQRDALREGVELKFVNSPENVREIADISGVGDVIPFA